MIHTFFGMILRGGFLVQIGPKARKSYLFWYDFVLKSGSGRRPGPEARIHTFSGMKSTKNRAEGPIFSTLKVLIPKKVLICSGYLVKIGPKARF